jgi:predicted RNase H-like HicB family nuclease
MAASAGPHHYRIVMSFDRDKSTYVARVPELGCHGEGPSRPEAMAAAEAEIEAQIANIVQVGGQVPRALDEDPPAELDLKVSHTLARELLWLARNEGIGADQLASELIAQGLEYRKATARRDANRAEAQQGQGGPRDGRDGRGGDGRRDNRDGRGPRPDGQGGRRDERGRGMSSSRYHAVMDDRANFIEYVRSLENNDRGPRRK